MHAITINIKIRHRIYEKIKNGIALKNTQFITTCDIIGEYDLLAVIDVVE